MSEPKPFASLSSGLLARKGAARPAMRPQGFTPSNSGLEDLGWNDMGGDHPQAEGEPSEQVIDHPRAHHRAGLTPVQSPVHSQQAELADRLNEAGEECGEEFDEDFDETAEPYEPEAGSGKFTGFTSPSDDEEEETEAAPETEFKVQYKTPKRPLDLGPAPELAEDRAEESVAEPAEAFEDTLELDDVVAVVPQPEQVPTPVFVAPPRTAPSTAKAKAAFTLRLDPTRHLKLRLACAVRGRSAQQLVTDALDQLLGDMPELDDMADKAQKRG